MRPADCAELVECISPQTRRYMPVLFRISTTWLRLPLHSGVLTQAPSIFNRLDNHVIERINQTQLHEKSQAYE